MSTQPARRGSDDIPYRAVTVGGWCGLFCINESLRCGVDEVVVLWVVGEVDLCTVPILQAALERCLDQYPAHLVVDLTRMTFCSVRGLELLTQAGRSAAEKATSYAVSGTPPSAERVWTLCWGDDFPIRYPSTTAAVTAIRAAG